MFDLPLQSKEMVAMKRFGLSASLITALLLNVGCGVSTDVAPPDTADAGHDHAHEGHGHHHAETYSEAITELTEIRNTIRDAFAKNDTEAAHGPLHDVGHVLEQVVELAEKQGITGDQLTAVKASVDTLFTAFGNVDKTMHGGEGSTYTEESETIDAAVKVLTDAVPGNAAPEPVSSESTDSPATEAAPPATTDTPAAETPTPETPAAEPKAEGSGT